ncbi:hypothetical protein [Pseudomonas chlororaphis]|uniref:hypothetical protein n=1 Tax=Pseudomonas chlororaphis TaxID=587753 RepID=UPI000F578911|nr:hypothetical protein [Pseudomonas chlororaphis]
MIKKLLALLLLSQLMACSNQPSSAYESGWTNSTNENAYATCGVYRVKKGMQDPSVMQRLVTSRALSIEQAQRAIRANVQAGDPECLAYAAYGLDRYKIIIQKNSKGEDIGKTAIYRCTQSDVPCPGVAVGFSDGKVTSTTITSD